MTCIFRDPNGEAALVLRERFPTPEAVALANLDQLFQIRAATGAKRFTRQRLKQLQVLASETIGVTERGRREALVEALVFEQAQVIQELRVLQGNVDAIDARITTLLTNSREGRILLSIPGIGTSSAAAILAAIDHIASFPTPTALKAYFGWAPRVTYTGTSRDRTSLSQEGRHDMRTVLYMVALTAIRVSPAWADKFQRLVERKYPYDQRLGRHTGKKVVIGRIAGQITSVIYALLRADAKALASTPSGVAPPEPQLYDEGRLHVVVRKERQSARQDQERQAPH